MRNLIQYPVTKQEIVECLKDLLGECDPDLCGDMRPTLIGAAISIVSAYNGRLGPHGFAISEDDDDSQSKA